MSGLLKLGRVRIFLVRTLLVFLVALGSPWGTSAALADTPILSAPEAVELVGSGDIVLLDIRSPEEWQETGLAEGAWPVSMHVPGFPQRLQFILDQYGPEKVALICATGGRSAYVAEVLGKNGLTGVSDVSEGMLGNGSSQGWVARGLPVVTVEAAQAKFAEVENTWGQSN